MKQKIDQIPAGNYVGYYWLSDANVPQLVVGNFAEEVLNKPLPFIAEGHLYDAGNNRSISIRHDGRRHVLHLYELNNLSGFEKNPIFFIAHRLPGKGRVKFWELWKEVTDPLCAGMNTLQPYARVFVGFEENHLNNR